MKSLSKFLNFDSESFLKDKVILILAHEEWVEYENNKPGTPKGYKYKCVIAYDKTNYGDDIIGLNEGENIVIKVPGNLRQYKKLGKIKIINPKCTIYGEYRNLLSITAENFEMLQ